jgi:toxin ParE1/3/4
MKLSFHPEAEREFGDAAKYYEHSDPGIGSAFIVEVLSSIQNIHSHPLAWPTISGDIRRCLVNRFPYGVLYYVQRDEIIILAVMHLHRHPDYWRARN